MRTISYILRKEFIQIFRNRTMLPIIFIIPIVQMVVLVFAANMELKNIDMTVVDRDKSMTSQRLLGKFVGSPYYNVTYNEYSIDEAVDDLYADRSDMVLHIPENFERDLHNDKRGSIQVLINAINNTSASLMNGYTNSIVMNFNKNVMVDILPKTLTQPSGFAVESSFWYNPELNYKIFMLPGILVILVTIIGMFLTALNLVREKEIGTIEQINVTPIRKHHLLIGKLVPFWIIGMFELAFGLTIGFVFFQLPLEGSLFTLFGFGAIYLLVALGIGLFLSTVAENQQQVMFLSYFFMLTFILMSGIFTPAESMPDWAQVVNYFNPFYYFIRAIRMILLKGSSFVHVLPEALSLAAYALVVFSLSLWRYRKTV